MVVRPGRNLILTLPLKALLSELVWTSAGPDRCGILTTFAGAHRPPPVRAGRDVMTSFLTGILLASGKTARRRVDVSREFKRAGVIGASGTQGCNDYLEHTIMEIPQ